MPRSPKADPAMADRLRRARAVEDDAVAAVTAAQCALDTATTKRADALAALDATVRDAETALARARGELVEAAGLDRAALTLGISTGALRKCLPTPATSNGQASPPPSATTTTAAASRGRGEAR